jgi:hypothetical protein
MDSKSPVGGDCVLLAHLAWETLQGSKQAVGENDELTREFLGLYKILSRLQHELGNPTSMVNRANDERRRELEEHAADCEGILKIMNTVLEKYNALGREQRRRRRLWQKIKFGNGEMKDLREIRNSLSAHTSAITLGFNLCALDSPGRMETTLEMAEEQSRRYGRSLRGIRKSLHWVIANMSADVGEGSVRSSYANDDKTFWRRLRKELVKEGYDNYTLQKHRRLIKAYVEELVNRGVLDDQGVDNAKYIHTPRPRLQRVRSNFYLQSPSRINSDSTSPPQSDQLPRSFTTNPSFSDDVEMTDVATNGDEVIVQTSHPSTFETPQAVEIQLEKSEDSDLSSSTTRIEEVDANSDPPPGKQHSRPKLLFAVQIEEVIDEEFLRSRKDEFDEMPNVEISEPSMDVEQVEELLSNFSEISDDEELRGSADQAGEPSALPSMSEQVFTFNRPVFRRCRPVQVEDILDEDFVPGAHPNVFHYEDVVRDSDSERPPVFKTPPTDASAQSPSASKQPAKRVRWADNDALNVEQRSSPCKYSPEELPFIFHKEFRDFDKYQELQESSQALMEEQEAGTSRRRRRRRKRRSGPSSRTCSFITQNLYIPPATLYDLQYYRIPASYFHKFWHPARVPMYLHGNVFDGISFTNWIYGWTAYTFRDYSFQMSTVKRFGKQVIKLGSAITDIENADDAVKRKLPRDLYDESGKLWEDLENIVNDIMSESEDRLAKKRRGGRLEVEFVTRFCREMIAGDIYYRPIENFVKQTDDWCKKVRFHKDFVMLWELWAV